MTGSKPLTDAEIKNLKKFFEEKTGILERAAGLLRPEAEAGRSTGTYARNQRYLWASLRAALSRYGALLAQVPDRPGRWTPCPLGHGHGPRARGRQARPRLGQYRHPEAEIEAARKGPSCDAAGDVHRSAEGEGMTAEVPVEKEEASFSYEEAAIIPSAKRAAAVPCGSPTLLFRLRPER